jgi:hypothetical protein
MFVNDEVHGAEAASIAKCMARPAARFATVAVIGYDR